MSILYPKIRLSHLAAMLRYGVLGAILAGAYGIIHDQITCTISPEYFTRLKFEQFAWANFGFPPRIFVAEIGFLATWWVGFIAAWFIARVGVPVFLPTVAFRYSLRCYALIFATAAVASATGHVLGRLKCSSGDFSSWQDLADAKGVQDLPHFVLVAYMHNASYLGAVAGLLIAIIWLARLKRRVRPEVAHGPD